MHLHPYFLNYFLRFYLLIFREAEGQGEKHQCVFSLMRPPTGALDHNLGACTLTWNQTCDPLVSGPSTQSIETYYPGPFFFLFSFSFFFFFNIPNPSPGATRGSECFALCQPHHSLSSLYLEFFQLLNGLCYKLFTACSLSLRSSPVQFLLYLLASPPG